MTDDAPEQIGEGTVSKSYESHAARVTISGTEYIRTDRAEAEKEAAVAAEREACAEVCDVVTMDHIGDIVRSKGDEIRARANSDPLAARDAEVRAEALREAAATAKDIAGQYVGCMNRIERAILALIPADQEEDG